ncbi:MAG: aspartate/glutamate racemase family protein [Pseudomonadota bacterium]
MAIGVFDSGLGGLTVLRHLLQRLPGQDFVFYGDNRHAPYGPRAPEQIHELTEAAVARLFDEGCELVILACNTASAVSLRRLQETWLPQTAPDNRVLGVFVPVIEALTGRPWGYRGPPMPSRLRSAVLFGTRATVASGAFRRETVLRASGVQVVEQPCPTLVNAIEANDLPRAGELVRGFVAKALRQCPRPQAAVLGCTHYPIVESAFRAALPSGTRILIQPQIVADSLVDYLLRHPRFAGGAGRLRLLTSGDPDQIATAAAHALGQPASFAAA